MRTKLRFTKAASGSRFATAATIAVMAVAYQIASADPAAERRSYEEASAALQKLDDTSATQLAAWLKSPNAYQRQAALLRYLERPSLMAAALLRPLLGMLDDGESHPLGDCVEYAFLDDANLNEGTWERRAACWWSAKSNATLATSALETLVRNVRQSGNQRDIALACTQVLEVFEQLKHDTVLSSTAREICDHRAVLQRATRPNQTAPVTHELLRLVLAIGVPPSARDLVALLPLLQGSEPDARAIAALVVLLAARSAGDATLRDAVRILSACINDASCPAIVSDIRAIRGAAAPLGAALVRRLSRPKATDQIEVLDALVAIRPLPAGTVKYLARLLDGPLVDTVLALSAELDEADARALRPAVVRALRIASDASAAARALRAAGTPVSGPEFRQVDAIFQEFCVSSNRRWCPEAEDLLSAIAIERGFRFTGHR